MHTLFGRALVGDGFSGPWFGTTSAAHPYLSFWIHVESAATARADRGRASFEGITITSSHHYTFSVPPLCLAVCRPWPPPSSQCLEDCPSIHLTATATTASAALCTLALILCRTDSLGPTDRPTDRTTTARPTEPTDDLPTDRPTYILADRPDDLLLTGPAGVFSEWTKPGQITQRRPWRPTIMQW